MREHPGLAGAALDRRDRNPGAGIGQVATDRAARRFGQAQPVTGVAQGCRRQGLVARGRMGKELPAPLDRLRKAAGGQHHAAPHVDLHLPPVGPGDDDTGDTPALHTVFMQQRRGR